MNIEGFFGQAEVITWTDFDAEIYRASVGGLRFSVTQEQLVSSESYERALTDVLNGVYKAVRAISEGFEWSSGIWDDRWAMSHGSLSADTEILG